MHTIRLIYASEANPVLSDLHGLTTLMERAIAYNTSHSLTGMLVYGNGRFLQVLEGERGEVNTLYNRIVQDAKHRQCTLLSATPIIEREFADWAMKLVGADDTPTAPRRAILLRCAAQTTFDPFLMTADAATRFLRALAESERRQAA